MKARTPDHLLTPKQLKARRWREAHREYFLQRAKDYRRNLTPEQRARMNESQRRRVAQRTPEQRAKHREQVKAWKKARPEWVKASNARYKANKKAKKCTTLPPT
jgi:hypothetical protein